MGSHRPTTRPRARKLNRPIPRGDSVELTEEKLEIVKGTVKQELSIEELRALVRGDRSQAAGRKALGETWSRRGGQSPVPVSGNGQM